MPFRNNCRWVRNSLVNVGMRNEQFAKWGHERKTNLSHITNITCWISHEKLVFSNICLFPGIISCILTSPNKKIQDGHQRPYWKFNSKENSPGNWYNITFPINYCIQSPFLASFVYFDRSECQNSRCSPSVISIVFRLKPFDPLFLLNVISETHFKQILLILCAAFAHISTMITKKSRDQ